MHKTQDDPHHRLQVVIERIKRDPVYSREKVILSRQTGAIRTAMEAVSTGRKDVSAAMVGSGLELTFAGSEDLKTQLAYCVSPGNTALTFNFYSTSVKVASSARDFMPIEHDYEKFSASTAIADFADFLEKAVKPV